MHFPPDRFVKRLAGKLSMEVDALGPLVDPQITALACQVDEPGYEWSSTLRRGDGIVVVAVDGYGNAVVLPIPVNRRPAPAVCLEW